MKIWIERVRQEGFGNILHFESYTLKVFGISRLTTIFDIQNIVPIVLSSHWPILGWNVSKSWLQKVDLLENYAIVAMQKW